MHWDRLPPLTIDDCPHRSARDTSGAPALCGLLTRAGLPAEFSEVRADACAACLREFPPTPDCWNTTIASLAYVGGRRAAHAVNLYQPEKFNEAVLEFLRASRI